MVEKLNDKLQSMDDNVAKIIDASLHQLELVVTKGDYPERDAVKDATDNVKFIGEALKSLSDGLESYRMTTKYIRDASPKNF